MNTYLPCQKGPQCSVSEPMHVGLQIEGAFIMGMGLCTTEEILVEPHTGKLLSDSTWTYKIPTAADIPRQFNVTFLKDSPNIRSVMSSKASGEPAMMLSMSVLYALRRAVLAAKNGLSEAALGGRAVPKGLSQVSGRDDGAHKSNMASASSQSDAHFVEDPRPAQGVPGAAGTGSVRDETSTSCVIEGSLQGNPFFVLEAPVTTCHGKEAMGKFSIVDILQAATSSTADLEYHSSGEWVVVH